MAKKKAVIYLALLANVGIAIAKIAAWLFTGSSSLLAESLHSVADSGNEVLLLIGQKRSRKPPDKLHQFGHGNELYFWTLVVGLSMFTLGGLASLLEGVYHVVNPEALRSPFWSYVTLGVAAVFEGSSFVFSYRQLLKQRQEGESVPEILKTSKDPTIFMVVFEDGAALVGLTTAFLGIFLAHLLDRPWLDGAGAIGVGMVLMGVAFFLVNATRLLLIGERADDDLLNDAQTIAESDGLVVRTMEPKSIHFGPDVVMLAIRAEFRQETTVQEVAVAIQRMHERIQRQHPHVKYVYIEPVG